jgi:deazaflavin-dependent oxidoreductase (nitroreductase family)
MRYLAGGMGMAPQRVYRGAAARLMDHRGQEATLTGGNDAPIPQRWQWVRDQVELYERTGGREGATLRDTGLPVIIVTMRGHKSGQVRKIALMRVEHNGEYALVGSMGGAPKHPQWYHNLTPGPASVTIQDGATPLPFSVHEAHGAERDAWWQHAVAAYPPYAEYQQRTERVIPVLIAKPAK